MDKDISVLFNENQTLCDYENNSCIHYKLEYQARYCPNEVAIIFKNQTVTYNQLNNLSNAFANKLGVLGVNIGDNVLVCLDRSIELIASIFGILKAGAVYVPVLPNYPAERKKFIVEDSAPKVIVTTREKAQGFNTNGQQLFAEEFANEKQNYNPPQTKVQSNNIAYLIYTSGTTGQPKGVMIEHHSVMNRIGWMQKAYPINTHDVLIQKTSIAFDVSVWELFWWSFTGSKLFLLNPGEEKDPEQILRQIGIQNVSVIHFVPSMLNEFIAFLKSIQENNALKNLKYIFCSGEALNIQSVKNLYSELQVVNSKAKIINLYGPTEATVDVTHYACSGLETNTIPIGVPIDNTQIYIVNEKNELLGINEKGELLISGVNLSRGYLNRETLTKEKFIQLDVHGKQQRAYRTGDIAYWDMDCNLIYLGRNDNQIKLRGYRIEIDEIESRLRTHSQIIDCTVIANKIKESDAALVGFCVILSGQTVKEDEIKDYLKKYLPDYMVPAQFYFIDKIPVTLNGKLNKDELVKLMQDLSQQNEQNELKSFNGNIEQTVYLIWCKLLNKTNINIESNFFDLGGNSLLIIQMSILLNKEFKTDIHVFDLFQYTNITSLSTYIRSKLT